MIKTAVFVKSVADVSTLKSIAGSLPEIAFVGRSNVGKSSLINMLCNQKSLAKTSATPGRTRLVNFFLINSNTHLVDLPGYGYALASKQEQKSWEGLLESYLTNSKKLRCVFVLMDIRHLPNENDKLMLKFLQAHNIAFYCIATKADKLSKAQISNSIQKMASELGVGRDNIIPTSVKDKLNKEKILQVILN